MEYIYAAMLLNSAGKEVTEDNITSIIEAAGLEADDARVKALVTALEDVDIEEAIESASMPAAQTAPAPTGGAEEEEKAEEEAEEEEKAEEEAEEEEEEEEGAAGIGDLFNE